jgi:hypothetical protein
LEKEEVELVIMVAQKILFLRNRQVFEGELVPPNCSVKCAIENFDEFRSTLTQTNPNAQKPFLLLASGLVRR